MTYEKPEQPPPLTPKRTAASGVPRCASFFLANSTALSEMVISRRDLGASEGAELVASGVTDEVCMGTLLLEKESGHGHGHGHVYGIREWLEPRWGLRR